MKSVKTGISTTSMHVTFPKVLKEHIEMRVAEGEFTSPSDFMRSLVRDDRSYYAKRASLLADIEAGLNDVDEGRVYDGEEVFAEILNEKIHQP